MKITEIKEAGFYKAIDNPHFILEILHLSDVKNNLPKDSLQEQKNDLFVDVWYHDGDKPYNHKKETYQSNKTIYKIDAIPDIFYNMEFIDDFDYDHTLYGFDGDIMIRTKKVKEEKIYN